MRLAATLLLFTTAAIAAPPDLSGTWRLDIENSRFDRQAPPKSAVDRFEHNEPSLAIHSTRTEAGGPEASFSLRYRIGSEGENEVMGNPMKYKASWDAQTLVIVTTGNFGDNSIRLTDRYTLSADGNTLTLLRRYEGRGGPQEQTLVLRREK
jgi:hypothetical protein